jgi:hypothetical protein
MNTSIATADSPDKAASFANTGLKVYIDVPSSDAGLCKKGDACEFLHEYNIRKMPECVSLRVSLMQAGSTTNIDIVRMSKSVCIDISIPRHGPACVLGMNADSVLLDQTVARDMPKGNGYVRAFSQDSVPWATSVLMLSMSHTTVY